MICSKYLYTYLFVFASVLVSSQQETNILYLKAKVNFENLKNSPERAFQIAKNIEEEAFNPKNEKALLIALQTQCSYFEKKYDFKNLLVASQRLQEEAEISNTQIYAAIAKEFQFKALIFSDLNDKALTQLNEGLDIIKKMPDQNDSLVIDTKANLMISYSNYYISVNKPRDRLRYINLAIKEHQKFRNQDYKNKLQYIDYANLATVYDQIDKDSAKFYANKSLVIDKDYNLNDIKYSNYIILGRIAKDEKKYQQALEYLKKAEELKNNRNHLNTEELYEIIITVYKELNDIHKQQEYQIKLDSLKIKIVKSQNESLHKIIADKDENSNSIDINWLYLIIPILFFILIYFLLKNKRNRIDNYTNDIVVQETDKSEEYSRLLEMFKNGDLAFITYFNDIFPDFTKKILEINPLINSSEIEFLAYLKLNIPTKDIVRYRNIAHRTVQNKKYIVRKKLNISTDIDIYKYLNVL